MSLISWNGVDDLVVEIVDHVAADGREAVGGVDMDVHRAFGVRAGRFQAHARHQLDRTGDFQVEEAQRALGVQPVDQVLDVGQRILRVHQAGDRVFELAPVDADRGVHREQVVLAGVIDVQVGVQHVAHVAHAHAVARELVLDHVLVELQPAHAERFHDLVRAVAGVDHDRPGAAEDQEAEGRHAPRAAAVAPEHQEARFQFDVAVVEDLDFECHVFPPSSSVRRGDRRASRCRAAGGADPQRAVAPRRRGARRSAPDRWSRASRSENSSRTGSAPRRRSRPSRA